MMSLPFIILHHDKTNPRIDIILISDVASLWLSQELYSNHLCHAMPFGPWTRFFMYREEVMSFITYTG